MSWNMPWIKGDLIFTPFYEFMNAMMPSINYDLVHGTRTKSSMVHTTSMAAPECHMDLPTDPTGNQRFIQLVNLTPL
jgi:hypothetical protein